MQYGATGEHVKILQRAIGCELCDGVFGPGTEVCVKSWQRKHNLTADGIFGPKSWSKLLNLNIVKTSRFINEIIIHCTATREGQEWTVEKVDKLHKSQGWAGIGYHYLIYLDGTIHNGRDVYKVGAHCTNHNKNSIGICYVGGLDVNGKEKDTRTLPQKDTFLLILACMRDLYPNAKIIGHRDTSKDLNHNGKIDKWEWVKQCPCFDVKSEYKL